jgi:hypothetical protein
MHSLAMESRYITCLNFKEAYKLDVIQRQSGNSQEQQNFRNLLLRHTGGNEAKQANSEVAYGLETELLLARGTRIMLTTNIWTEPDW